jgi:hypothetical protein
MASTAAGRTSEVSIDPSSIAISRASAALMGPWTRWLTIAAQTWLSQKTTTVTTTVNAIASDVLSVRHWTATMPVTSKEP